MNIVLWVIAVVLAATFLAAGLAKLTQPKQKLAASPNMAWTEDFASSTLKVIGAIEVLAAIGLLVPALVPVAAVGVALLMVGAAITHVRRHEPQVVVVNVVLIALAVVLAWGRFGPHSF